MTADLLRKLNKNIILIHNILQITRLNNKITI